MTKDWVRWHDAYADPDSELSRRQNDVVAALTAALESAPSGPIRVLTLCAGDARDLSRALHDHPRAPDVVGLVVEMDEDLASRARANLSEFEHRLAVACADASDPNVWQGILPVDLLILVGIFGNISDDDIRAVIDAVPTMCRLGSSIVWTRHRRPPDMTPVIAAWFAEAGCESQSFSSPGPNRYAVGAERYTRPRVPRVLPQLPIRFVDTSA